MTGSAGPDDGSYQPTSERMSAANYQSNVGDYLIYMFHVATYNFAREFLSGEVLDLGCGTGYGTHAVSDCCDRIVGVDIATDAVAFARREYQADNLSYEVIAPIENELLPFGDASFDAVISFQVIEHIANTDTYLREIARVLRPGGRFICSTPDRSTRLFPRQRPWNRYHVHEYSPTDLGALIATRFEDVRVHGMTADRVIIDAELRRCRKMRVMTYPFTFPGAPQSWRSFGLGLLKRLQRPQGAAQTVQEFAFDHTAIRIEIGATPSTDTVVVARR